MSPFSSPTLSPPTAYPSKPVSATALALSLRRSAYIPPWTMPKRAWSALDLASLHLRAQRWVISMDLRVYSLSAGWGGHSSKAMIRSAPSATWTSTAFSGERKCRAPSRCDWNSTPSSLIFLRRARLKTWKPPLSVRMGRCQFMKRWSPPSSLMSSWPGRSIRW